MQCMHRLSSWKLWLKFFFLSFCFSHHDFNRCTHSLSLLLFHYRLRFTWHETSREIFLLLSNACVYLCVLLMAKEFIEISHFNWFAVAPFFHLFHALNKNFSHWIRIEVIRCDWDIGRKKNNLNKLAHPWWLDKRTSRQWKWTR